MLDQATEVAEESSGQALAGIRREDEAVVDYRRRKKIVQDYAWIVEPLTVIIVPNYLQLSHEEQWEKGDFQAEIQGLVSVSAVKFT